MSTIGRWWERHWSQVICTALVVGTAWFVRQTGGAVISELYYLVIGPFEGEQKSTKIKVLRDARILELEQQLAEVEKQNEQLEALIDYSKSQKQPTITAPVIGRSADSWWQHITIAKGSLDGIKPGAAVMSVGGLVGRIVEVTPHTSRILLISDRTSRVGVTVSRSRQMGFIQGKGSQLAVMRFFEKVPDVRPGDAIATSVVSRLFPSGLTIGRVKSVKLDDGPAPEAIIELTAPLDSLEWVIVHPDTSTEELAKQ